MSLMNYGFTKSKVPLIVLDDSPVSDKKRQEAEMVPPCGKNAEKGVSPSQPKTPSKSPSKSSDKRKIETKHTNSLKSVISSSNKNSSKSNSKISPKKLLQGENINPKSLSESRKDSPSKKSPKSSKKLPQGKLNSDKLSSQTKHKNVSPEKHSKNKTPEKEKVSKTSPGKIKAIKTTPTKSKSKKVKSQTVLNFAKTPKMENQSTILSGVKKSPTDNSLPYHRIKMIMKSCPDVDMVNQETLHVVTKATELFIQHLACKSLNMSYVNYESLSNVVHNYSNLEFLKETIPKKITWEECQKLIAARRNSEDDYL